MRLLYRFLVRLHPQHFRRRFGDEMLWIFDDAGEKRASLFGDALGSLFRQWLLRSNREREAGGDMVRLQTSGDVPMFQLIETAGPRGGTLLHGGVLAAGFFTLFWLLVPYGKSNWRAPLLIYGAAHRGTKASDSSDRPAAGPGLHGYVIDNLSGLDIPGRRSHHFQFHPEEGAKSRTAPVLVPAELLRTYVGTYDFDAREGLKISVRLEGEQLKMQVPGQPEIALIARSERVFVPGAVSDRWIEFVKERDGSVGMRFYQHGRVLEGRRF